MENRILNCKFDKKSSVIPSKLRKRSRITQSKILEHKVWFIHTTNHNSDNLILFLHGGAYMSNINNGHWNIVNKWSELLSHTVVVPEYPLAPIHNFKDTYCFLFDLIYQLKTDFPNKKIILIGDSAGGGLALGFTQQWLNTVKDNYISKIILLSPWLDLNMSESSNFSNKKDLLLTTKGLSYAASLYAGNSKIDNNMLSPIHGNLSDLPEIHIFSGTEDLLYPQACKLFEKIKDTNISHQHYVYDGMFHDWILFDFLPEANDAITKIASIIQK